MDEQIDWYERRNELEQGMVFSSCWGIVKLERMVPGDGTQWFASRQSESGKWATKTSQLSQPILKHASRTLKPSHNRFVGGHDLKGRDATPHQDAWFFSASNTPSEDNAMCLVAADTRRRN